MKPLLLFILPVLMFFSGCICVDCGYTPNEDIVQHSYTESNKYPLTYSVSIYKYRDDIIFDPDTDDLREKIEERLRATNLFSEVQYVSKKEGDGYHVDFAFHLGGISLEQSAGLGFLSGYTLLTIPVWEEFFLDLRATIYTKEDPVFSVCSSEKLRCVIWLPFAPIGLFANMYVSMHMVEDGIINDAINNISEEHIRRYLKD